MTEVKQALDPAKQARARDYARAKRRLLLVESALAGIFLLLFMVSGLSAGLRDLLDFPRTARVALYIAILVLSYEMATAPLGFWGGFILPRRFGLSKQTFSSWLGDLVKGGVLTMVLMVGITVVIYQLLAGFPQIWWLLAGGLLALFAVAMTSLAPVLFLPLFFKSRPLNDADLATRLTHLAGRAQAKVHGVFTLDLSRKATTANAALAGLGRTRRILLTDTLLHSYTPEEIEVVLAHELGHHVHRDIPRLIGVQSAAILAGFYLTHLVLTWSTPRLGYNGISDIAAFPLFALVLALLALILRPAEKGFSRHLERAADRYSLSLTSNPAAFKSALTKLTNQNLSEAEPSRWVEIFFYDHPPYAKRVKLAWQYASGAEASDEVAVDS